MEFIVPKFIQYQLYLLQLENYELGRYWKLLLKRGPFPRKKYPLRKELVWSAKAYALMLMAFAVHSLVVIIAGLAVVSSHSGTNGLLGLLIFVTLLCIPFYFLWFTIALVLIRPLDSLAKKNLVKRARENYQGFII